MGDLLSRVVRRDHGERGFSAELTERKKAAAAAWGAQIALDDFGTGFNSERILWQDIKPDIVGRVTLSLSGRFN